MYKVEEKNSMLDIQRLAHHSTVSNRTVSFWMFFCTWVIIMVSISSCSSKEVKLSEIELPEEEPTEVIEVPNGNNQGSSTSTVPTIDEKPEKPEKTVAKPIKNAKVKQQESKPAPMPENEVVEAKLPLPADEPIYMRAEQMPRFPGCEHYKVSDTEKAKCAEKKLFEYIRASLKYPQQALKNDLEGEALIKFVVDKSGKIEQAELLSDPGSGMGKAALDVVNAMNDFSQKWTPGYQHGKPVAVWFVLPVRFSLGDMKR